MNVQEGKAQEVHLISFGVPCSTPTSPASFDLQDKGTGSLPVLPSLVHCKSQSEQREGPADRHIIDAKVSHTTIGKSERNMLAEEGGDMASTASHT